MSRPLTALVFAAATLVANGAFAQTPPPPKAEVLARWPNFSSDSFYAHYRDPKVTRSGSSVTLWKMAEPTPSMSKIGVPTLYTRLEFDCAGQRKKILAIARFNADGSVKPPPAQDVALDKWFQVIDGADIVLMKLVCAGG
jgi:hypothetical protein